jgi:hypothetical protein
VTSQGKAKKKAAYSDDEGDDDSDFETKVRLWYRMLNAPQHHLAGQEL